MPDHRLPDLGNKTPLEVANTPNLDFIAQTAEIFGMAKTIPDSLPPGSDVGNLSVLGYDPMVYYTGRSPLEAASIGIDLKPTDVTLRCNLVTLKEQGGRMIMKDYSAGHIPTDEAHKVLTDVKDELETDELIFHPGVSYRHLLVWKNGNADITTTPPHDISDREINPYFPTGAGSNKLNKLIRRSWQILKDHPVNINRIEKGENPANSIWLWGQGTAPKVPTLENMYGIKGSVISAVDLVKGIGHYTDMTVVNVPGATGYLDTNYEGKVDYALNSLDNVDLTMIHIESTDETGHVGKVELKIQAVEDFDKRVVGRALEGVRKYKDYRILVMSDHPTPIDVRTHVNEPVPFAIVDSSDMNVKNKSFTYTEDSAAKTGVYIKEGWKLMGMLIERY